MQEHVDFRQAVVKANELLVKAAIRAYPFDPRSIVKQIPNCVCRKASQLRRWGAELRDLGSESAILTSFGGRNIVFYDETKPIYHVGFSILHELGHLLLQHPLRTRNMLCGEYHRYELEANFFAAQMLMPYQIISELTRRHFGITQSSLSSVFGVSQDAAHKRLVTLSHARDIRRSASEREFDDIIVDLAAGFLESICPSYSLFDIDTEEKLQRQRDRWM